ncbi:VanW family protein [Cytobacillus purgationiresistens]|uniref:Vancomycin resistance protein YoaR n=1 Tax=Cytobacillus purgationiresistens TaxID=863449 RepID=A0ABU0AG42_9BACI|nr:VanW family protein [Cytobacillus purgationiresistens]MDQ0269839.1 vancomycin resistance protein YoaR [Cytobacillus purgationiresistens]
MKRNKGMWTLLFIITVLLLSGCAGKSEKEVKLEKEVVELQKKVDDLEKEQENEEKTKEIETVKEPEVVLIDPQTKEKIKTFIPKEYGNGVDEKKYKDTVEAWARDLALGTDDQKGYDQRMIPDRIDENGKIIKGNPRIILEEEELVSAILSVSDNGGEVEIPLYITASGYEQADATQLNEVVLASYSTQFNNSVAGRTKNIELSAKAIDNVILGIDDIFSFNTTVGPSDEEHGYQPAEEAVNGKLVMGIGGGICQTSSTLFNAVDKLKVEYVEKHHHSVTVGYVPKGRDATVSYGGLDFRFQNTTGIPLLIQTKMENGSLTVEIKTSKAYETVMSKQI